MEQRLEPEPWPRHGHRRAYAAFVLSGGYIEAGAEGRWRAEAGDILAHPAFDTHQNAAVGRSWVLNIPLPATANLPPVFRVADPDELERVWRHDPALAGAYLTPIAARPPLLEDWPDLLAADLRDDPSLSLSRWARIQGLAPATVSRGFSAAFGAPPSVLRTERRARRTLRDVITTDAPLAAIAHDRGFADQAHLSRAVRALTGFSPSHWRRVKSIQDGSVGPL